MRIESIHLKNYRCFADMQVQFRPGFNVLVGVNGSGKTSLLRGLCAALSEVPSMMPESSGQFIELGDGAARVKTDVLAGRYRFEAQYPVELNVQAHALGAEQVWTISKTGEKAFPVWRYQSPDHQPLAVRWQAALAGTLSDSSAGNPHLSLPVVAFYRASRQWIHVGVNPVSAASERPGRANGYAGWWDASVDAQALQSWVIGKCLERLQICTETNRSFDDIHDDELASVNHALAAAMEGGKGLKYDMARRSLIFEWVADPASSREPVSFENLSDGQRAIICLVADIARRMCLLNPHLGKDVAAGTAGVVLIDELDMHLHPRWQRILTTGLKKAFPSVQFIVASHSPQVLGELQPEEIILLRAEGASHPQASYGLSSSQVLQEIMGGGSRSPEVEQLLAEVGEALTRGDLERGRAKIDDLQVLAPGVPELVGAQALLRRKEVLGK